MTRRHPKALSWSDRHQYETKKKRHAIDIRGMAEVHEVIVGRSQKAGCEDYGQVLCMHFVHVRVVSHWGFHDSQCFRGWCSKIGSSGSTFSHQGKEASEQSLVRWRQQGYGRFDQL